MSTDYAVYRELVTQLMQGQECLPSLPRLTLQIRTALQSDNVGSAELARLIALDPALSALLVKHASSAWYRQARAPQGLSGVIQLLGHRQVGSITMAHSLKSLFTLHSPAYQRLFREAWQRQVLKAGHCAALARSLGVAPEHALLAGLLSEVGSLVLLSAFKDQQQPPSTEYYHRLCREFSRSLGVILLKRWAVDETFVMVIRQAGHWEASNGPQLDSLDLVNLVLHQLIGERDATAELPPLEALAAYAKLPPAHQLQNPPGHLWLFETHRDEAEELARSLG